MHNSRENGSFSICACAHKDGAVIVSFTSNQPIGILRAFFAYGEDIIPLAPQTFVDEWTETVKKMAKNLGL